MTLCGTDARALNVENICQESLCLPYAKKKINYRTDTKELNVENICQASDVEDVLCLPRAMLRTFPNVTLTNKMLDAHLYIFSRWVLDLIEVLKEIKN